MCNVVGISASGNYMGTIRQSVDLIIKLWFVLPGYKPRGFRSSRLASRSLLDVRGHNGPTSDLTLLLPDDYNDDDDIHTL
jgi:hypothetical protein